VLVEQVLVDEVASLEQLLAGVAPELGALFLLLDMLIALVPQLAVAKATVSGFWDMNVETYAA
jgi:hypothetical protein